MKKGFTLIELLIVIGILAILATTVVLVLNPAQILAETRDTQRISDLGSVQSAIGLYLATAPSPGLGGTNGTACPAGGLAVWRASNTLTQIADGQPFSTPATEVAGANSGRATDGTGWIAVDLQDTSGGSPIGTLPVDPAPVAPTANNGLPESARFYAYQCSGNTYEINANMESTKFSSGTSNIENADGGTLACSGVGAGTNCTLLKADAVYEIGTDPNLDL